MIAQQSLSNLQWFLIAALATAWLVTCFRMAVHARRYGRSPVVWFLVTLFFTAVPATIVFWMDYRRSLTTGRRTRSSGEPSRTASGPRDEPFRCPHCQAVLIAGDLNRTGAVPACPECGQALRPEDVA